MMQTRLTLAGGLAVATVVAPAAAQPHPQPALRWLAPAGCPQAQGMRERIRTIAGSASLRESRLQVDGEITKQADGRFLLKLVLRDGELVGQRNLASDSCEDLAGAAAVAVGLLLSSEAPLTEDQLRGAAAAEAPDAASAQTKSGAAPTSEPARESTRSPDEHAAGTAPAPGRWRGLVRAPGVSADFGLLPRPSFGLSLGAGLSYEQWRFLVQGGIWLDQTVYGTNLPSHGAEVGRMAAMLIVGRGFRIGSFDVGPCLTLALERITAQGSGPGVTPLKETASWLSVGAGAFGSLRLGDAAALVVELGGRVETSRPVIAIDGLGDVRQLGPVALTTAVGAEWFF